MKSIPMYFLQWVLIYCLIVIFAEVASANLQARSIDQSTYQWKDVTLSAISKSIEHAGNLEWRQLKMLELTVWVYNNKIHYYFIVLLALVLYYHYKDSRLKQPTISRLPKKDVGLYEREKQELTQRKVRELQESKEYKDYVNSRRWEEEQGQRREETDADWDRAEEEIFDQ